MAPPPRAAAPAPSEPALRRAPASSLPRGALLIAVLAALVLGVGLLRTYVVAPVSVSSTSMTPTLLQGDVVLVDRRPLDVSELSRGDLITFHDPRDGEETLKRVVGLPGDTVATIDAILHVNGEPVEEPYVDFSEWEGMFTARVTVPADHVYVLGDNRLDSVDSRDFGPVPGPNIDGRVVTRIWPVVRIGGETPQPPQP